jgi:hypothetical protein
VWDEKIFHSRLLFEIQTRNFLRLRNLKVHDHVYKSQELYPILSRMNPVPVFTHFSPRFILILSYHLRLFCIGSIRNVLHPVTSCFVGTNIFLGSFFSLRIKPRLRPYGADTILLLYILSLGSQIGYEKIHNFELKLICT